MVQFITLVTRLTDGQMDGVFTHYIIRTYGIAFDVISSYLVCTQ